MALSAFQPFSPSAFSQAPATATITGRVFSVATGQYLRNAEVRVAGTENYVYTGDDGSYSITVPAGAVELAASYSGVLPMTSPITTTAGATATLNFDLQPVIIDPSAATAATGPVVLLDRFEVTADREGQAKAIMDQRAAIHAATIIAADNFGDITMGSLGEILKYMPGISLDYGETDAEGVRIGGLDPKYTAASLDGIGISTSGRTVNLSTLTSTGIETIEFIQTLTASMDASAAAGRLNFVSKDPFSRRGTQFRYQFGLNGHSDGMSLGGSYLLDDRKHNLIFPSAQINYGGVFLNRRLAIELNLSYNGTYNLVQQQITYYSYLNPGPINPHHDYFSDEPVVTALAWRPLTQILNRYGASLNVGYKITPHLTFSVRSGLFYEERESYMLYAYLRAFTSSGAATYAPSAGIDLINSTHTHWIVNSVGSTQTRLNNDVSWRRTTNYTRLLTPRLTYKRDNFTIDLYGGYTGSDRKMRDTDHGFFRSSNSYLSNVSWTADRPSTDSPTWTLTQTGGDPWNIPENWSKRDYYSYGINSWPDTMKYDQYAGGLDFTYARRVFGIPVTFKTGGLLRRNERYWRSAEARYNYLGPTGRPQEAPIPFTQNYVFTFPLGGKGGNISDQGWRIDDARAAYNIYKEHPEWFVPQVDNVRREITSRQDLTEDINAAYFELNARVNRLRFNAGVRFEETRVETLGQLRRTNEDVIAGGYDPNTAEGILYQYYNGDRYKRNSSYSNFFLSGGLKYDITRNLQAQLSASQSILRPDYNNIAGTLDYDEDNTIIRVPNTLLKPENMTKFYASLNYRLEPAGIIRLSAYRMDIKDKQIGNIDISRQEAEAIVGYPLPPDTEESAPIFRTTINSPSSLSVYGVTLEYNQQLTFLPGYLKGLSIFSSVTFSSIKGAQIDEDKIGQINKSANGGFRYRVGRVSIDLRGTWTDDSLYSVTRPIDTYYWFHNDHRYMKGRFIMDLSGGFKLTSRYELSFSIRNILNSPRIIYSNVPDRLSLYVLSGAYWNVSIKGNF